MKRFEPPLVIAQSTLQPAVAPVDCPFCGIQACMLIAVRFVQPEPLPVDTEPTPEQRESLERGTQAIQAFQCQNEHQWQAVFLQRPHEVALMLLTTLAGEVLDRAALAQSKQRYQQTARLVVARQ